MGHNKLPYVSETTPIDIYMIYMITVFQLSYKYLSAFMSLAFLRGLRIRIKIQKFGHMSINNQILSAKPVLQQLNGIIITGFSQW